MTGISERMRWIGTPLSTGMTSNGRGETEMWSRFRRQPRIPLAPLLIAATGAGAADNAFDPCGSLISADAIHAGGLVARRHSGPDGSCVPPAGRCPVPRAPRNRLDPAVAGAWKQFRTDRNRSIGQNAACPTAPFGLSRLTREAGKHTRERRRQASICGRAGSGQSMWKKRPRG
jgi:hypothetical protein